MALHKVLPAFAVFYLLVSVAPAQAPLPASTQVKLATEARLEGMTLDDFTRIVSQAQAGLREAQYLLALAYEEGRFVIGRSSVQVRSSAPAFRSHALS